MTTKKSHTKKSEAKIEITEAAAPALTPETIQNVPPGRRTALITLGAQFGSADTLTQADATLNALATNGDVLRAYGFVTEDTARLTAARDGLLAAGVGRLNVVAVNKTTTAAYDQAVVKAQSARKVARAVLTNARRDLDDSGEEAANEASIRVGRTLDATTSTSSSRKQLGTQLDELLGTFADATVAAAATERGGPAALAKLQEAKEKLRTTKQTKTKARGTPKETQTLDFFDGVIVELTRSARTAAQAAADDKGDPALAKDFELTHLYRITGRKKATTGEQDGGDVNPPGANGTVAAGQQPPTNGAATPPQAPVTAIPTQS